MGQKHSKKRNVGLVYEQLLRRVAQAIVEGDEKSARKCISIIQDTFKPGSEILREFRLFNALVKTTASSEAVAQQILSEARPAARAVDAEKLEKEKTTLTHRINHEIGGRNFYDQRIPEYRMYATIQTLLNDWRDGSNTDIVRLSEYEGKVRAWLVEKKTTPTIEELSSVDVDSLVVKIMSEKFNEKYGSLLNEEQRKIVRDCSVGVAEETNEKLTRTLSEVKDRALSALDGYVKSTVDKYARSKALDARREVGSLDPAAHSADNVSRFMTISQLRHEIGEGT